MLSGEINRASVKYGSNTIDYAIQEKDGLKSHYISVEKLTGVTLKGKRVSSDKADKLILKKARWILDKLSLVGTVRDEDIVTGSRLPYLGKSYYVQVVVKKDSKKVVIEFNDSKFKITVNSKDVSQASVIQALEQFYKEKAIEKIAPRVKRWSEKTRLSFKSIRFIKMGKRWGSCTSSNIIILNTEAVKLPFTLIDYLIVHELCHTKVKDHSKRYWAELSKHMPKWKELDEKIKIIKV